MNQKNYLIASIILNVMLIALIFMVKKNAAGQAQEFVKNAQEKTKYEIGQVKDNIENNNLLWTLIDSTWKSPDKSRGFVKKLADAQKLPRCKGKPCTGDDARLSAVSTTNEKERSIKVSWSKYFFKVIYDPKEKTKDKFVTIDVSDLLGKSTEEASDGEETEEAEAEE